jgi:hypothetical protein
MKRGGLFFIGLISAIITIVSLNIAFGRRGYDEHRSYHRMHSCDRKQDYHNDERSKKDQHQYNDSTTSNY